MSLTDERSQGAHEASASAERVEDGEHATKGSSGGQGEESEVERVNRRWNEILQETRVAQTGVQILFGFLLSVAFTPLFRELGTFDRTVYVLTVVLGAAATGALIAPVSIHRFLSGQRMKDELVAAAGRLMMCGIVLLALTIGCTVLIILHVVLPSLLAEILAGVVMLWFAFCWYLLPLILRRRADKADKKDEGAR
ncbi:DUF6328 family protein [Streptomyces sp. NPDC005481]|uniref:DUF6328 family protein n=1 Tax=Streptomyces sp. NPDC005481 TaxID=3154881 RepID=UPI0033ACD73C